jgi:hypothetical protein
MGENPNKDEGAGGNPAPPRTKLESRPNIRFGALKNRMAHAAFRLGYRSRFIRVAQRAFWFGAAILPVDYFVVDYVSRLIDEFREDCRYLEGEFNPEIIDPLDATLNYMFVGETRLVQKSLRGPRSSIPFGSPEIPGELTWRELCRLADLALPRTHTLRSLYEFGAALGHYELSLPDLGTGLPRVERGQPLPDLAPLLRAVSNLPVQIVERVELLGPISQLVWDREKSDHGQLQDSFLSLVLGSHQGHKYSIQCDYINNAITIIINSIFKFLGECPFDLLYPNFGNKVMRPRWNSERGILFLDGVQEKKVARRGYDPGWTRLRRPVGLSSSRISGFPIIRWILSQFTMMSNL